MRAVKLKLKAAKMKKESVINLEQEFPMTNLTACKRSASILSDSSTLETA